ncbi:MAG: hypothetical protein ACRDRK_05440 [Pseudonocardia sp.]
MSSVEWTVATLAPWAVAPHPNFSSSSANAPQLLALVADYRRNELDRYLPLLVDNTPDAHRTFITDAAAATRLESQGSATPRMATWCASTDLPVGARVAAALFASACFAEIDNLAASISAIEAAMAALSDLSADSSDGSLRIMRSSLLLNRAIRALEFGDRRMARNDSEVAIEISSLSESPRLDEFPVSEAISWSSFEVQIDVIQCVNLRAQRLWSALAPIRDNSWVELVRSRPNWLDVRAERRASPGLEMFLSETFSGRFDAHSRSVRFASEDGVVAPIEASLFNAEVSSDFSDLATRRKQLGMLRLLRASTDQEATSVIIDGIKLLRRARDKKALEPALRDIRARGPLAPLKISGQEVLQIADHRNLNRYELLVLAAGAEVLTEDELRNGIDATFHFLDGGDDEPGSTQGLAGWTRLEAGWRAVTALTPHADRDSQVADAALNLLTSDETPYLLSGLIVRVADAIDWQRVATETLGKWREWASKQISPEFADLAWRLLDVLPESSDAPGQRTIARPSGLALAERIVVESQRGNDASPAELVAATSAIMEELDKIRVEATRGSHALGGRSAPLIAAHMAARLGVSELWRPLIDLLKSHSVAAVDKTLSLEFLAGHLSAMPESAKDEIAVNWQAVVSAPEDPFSGRGSIEFVSATLSLGVRLGTISSVDYIAGVTELSCGSPAEQIEALRCIAYSDSDPVLNQWIATLAVQLSLSLDPSVQANAAFVLARRIELHGEMRQVATRQLLRMLTSDAIQVPLLALRGVGDASPPVDPSTRDTLLEVVARLAAEHLAVSVRRAASGLLDSWGVGSSFQRDPTGGA